MLTTLLTLFLAVSGNQASARFLVTCNVVTARHVVFSEGVYLAPKATKVQAGESTLTYFEGAGDAEPRIVDGTVVF